MHDCMAIGTRWKEVCCWGRRQFWTRCLIPLPFAHTCNHANCCNPTKQATKHLNPPPSPPPLLLPLLALSHSHCTFRLSTWSSLFGSYPPPTTVSSSAFVSSSRNAFCSSLAGAVTCAAGEGQGSLVLCSLAEDIKVNATSSEDTGGWGGWGVGRGR